MFKTQKARMNHLCKRFNTGFYLIVLFKQTVTQALDLSFIGVKSNEATKEVSFNDWI